MHRSVIRMLAGPHEGGGTKSAMRAAALRNEGRAYYDKLWPGEGYAWHGTSEEDKERYISE